MVWCECVECECEYEVRYFGIVMRWSMIECGVVKSGVVYFLGEVVPEGSDTLEAIGR